MIYQSRVGSNSQSAREERALLKDLTRYDPYMKDQFIPSASLLAAFLLELTQFLLLWLLAGARGGLIVIPILAGFGLLRLVISALTGLVIVYAVLSWVPTQSSISDVIERLCAPPLKPIRRLLPLVGGVDLSPLVLLLVLQIAGIVLGSLQALALQAG